MIYLRITRKEQKIWGNLCRLPSAANVMLNLSTHPSRKYPCTTLVQENPLWGCGRGSKRPWGSDTCDLAPPINIYILIRCVQMNVNYFHLFWTFPPTKTDKATPRIWLNAPRHNPKRNDKVDTRKANTRKSSRKRRLNGACVILLDVSLTVRLLIGVIEYAAIFSVKNKFPRKCGTWLVHI